MMPSRPCSGRLDGTPALADDVIRKADPGCRPEDDLEEVLAALERAPEERAAVEVEQVEDLVHEAASATARA